MPKSYHYAFKKEYPNLSQRFVTDAEVVCISGIERKVLKVNALWDTGAMLSAITPTIAQSLNLIPINRVKVNGINNVSMADVVKIHVKLPNLVMVNDVNAAVCNLVKDVDLLIGMDIIAVGDFSISNGEGKTLFSFVIPPFENKTDHYEKALAINKRNKL